MFYLFKTFNKGQKLNIQNMLKEVFIIIIINIVVVCEFFCCAFVFAFIVVVFCCLGGVFLRGMGLFCFWWVDVYLQLNNKM